jgi:hypothetical protein
MSALYDSGFYEDDPYIVTIKPGSIITYLLSSKDKPVDPLKVWRGKVKLCDSTHIVVELTERGYESMTETITYNQVVSIERSPLK